MQRNAILFFFYSCVFYNLFLKQRHLKSRKIMTIPPILGQLSPRIPSCHRNLAVISQVLLQPADMQFPKVLQLQIPKLVETDRMCQSMLINKQI